MLSTCTSPPARDFTTQPASWHRTLHHGCPRPQPHDHRTPDRGAGDAWLPTQTYLSLPLAPAHLSFSHLLALSILKTPSSVSRPKKKKPVRVYVFAIIRMEGEATECHTAGAADATAALQKGTCTFLLHPRSIAPLQLLRLGLALCPASTLSPRNRQRAVSSCGATRKPQRAAWYNPKP